MGSACGRNRHHLGFANWRLRPRPVCCVPARRVRRWFVDSMVATSRHQGNRIWRISADLVLRCACCLDSNVGIRSRRRPRMEEFIACFSEVSDPRGENVRHNLYEVLIIALCTMLCGGEDCSDMAVFGHAKRPFLRQFLCLKQASPAMIHSAECFASSILSRSRPASCASWNALRRASMA